MSKDIDTSGSLSDEDVMYLAQRDQLPDDPELQERAQRLLSGLSDPTPIDSWVNTGTVNTEGLTQEQYDRAVELLRQDQEANSGGFDSDSDDEDDEDDDEDYLDGWNNDGRRDELKTRGLVTTGDKEEMIARLLRSDSDTLLAEDYPDGKLPEG